MSKLTLAMTLTDPHNDERV